LPPSPDVSYHVCSIYPPPSRLALLACGAPLPYGQRPTLRVEVVKDTVWTFEQFQGIFYVVVPIRMTVVRLEPTGLLVYSPVAPTRVHCPGARARSALRPGQVHSHVNGDGH
jgi:hypothetical protein